METEHLPNAEEKFFFHMHNFDDEVMDEIEAEDQEDLPPPPPVFTESELAAAKKQAYGEGHAAGKTEVEQSRAQSLANLMQKLAHDLQVLFIAETEREATFEREAVAVSRALFKHAFPTLMAAQGQDELLAQLKAVLAAQQGQSSIEVRVSNDYAQGVLGFVEKLKSRNSDLRVDVISDDSVPNGAFKLSWKDGGAIYDANKIAQTILGNLEEMLAGGDVTSHDEGSEESNITSNVTSNVSGDDATIDAPKETPDTNNDDPIAEDDSNDG